MLPRSMFREAIKKLSLRQKLMILASVGVLLPLLILTYMQYRSLAELQTKTKGAFKDNLRQGLNIVERQMKQQLADIAAQTLKPIGSMRLSSPTAAQEFEKYFADVKRSQPGIQEIFVFGYSGEQQKTNAFGYLYSDTFVKIAPAELTPKHSHILFLFDKSRMAQSFLDGNQTYSFVHQSCPTCPPSSHLRQGTYLFYPLHDLQQEHIGFAGVLLKEAFVTDELIAGIIKPLVASHSPPMTITISDQNGHPLYSNAAPQSAYLLESNLGRPFSDWKAAIGLKDTSIENLARDSFLSSAAVTLLVLLFLLGGTALTLRATDREARLAQAKSDFVSNVSHELKTPLSTI